MRRAGPVFLIIALTTVGAAAETRKPLSQWTCADFSGTDDIIKPKIIYWATGVAKGKKPGSATIDIVDTEKIIPFVGETCQRNPKASFWQTLKAEWEKVEASAGKLEKKL